MIDNRERAYFIVSLGSLNNYGSTLAATKRALDQGRPDELDGAGDDRGIFEDALAGIAAVKQTGFSVDGIIAINTSFTNSEEEDPAWPGHLRNGYYNEDDRTSIITGRKLDERGRQVQEAYFPPDQVSRGMLQQVVDDFNESDHSQRDGWRVFADLAKMQPFQDGNKRTALIAANAAMGTLENQDYLALPLNALDNTEFTLNLMRYYQATDPASADRALGRMVALAPNREQRERAWQEQADRGKQAARLATRKVKPLFGNIKN